MTKRVHITIAIEYVLYAILVDIFTFDPGPIQKVKVM